MNCPECGNPYVCPCESCRNRNPDIAVWEYSSIGEIDYQECSKCGLVKSTSEWMDEEYKQYQEIKNEISHTSDELSYKNGELK